MADLDADALAACGFPRRKVEYVQDFAGHFGDGRIGPKRWTHEEDESVNAKLIDVHGIGKNEQSRLRLLGAMLKN